MTDWVSPTSYIASFLGIKNPAPKLKIFTRAVLSFLDNDLTTSAAAISYFTMLLLFPLLIVVLSVSQTIFGNQEVKLNLIKTILALLPGTSSFVRANVEAAIRNLSPEIVISSILIVLWASSWIFSVIEKALNRIWGTTSRTFLHGRMVTIGMAVLLGGVLIISAAITTFVALLRAKAQQLPVNAPPSFYTLSGIAWQITFAIVSLVLTITIFILIYRVLPNTQVTIIETLPGAIISGLCWEGAKYSFAWVLPHFHYDLFYGPIGLAVALLTWVYISSIIMLFGAQLTALLHVEHLFDRNFSSSLTASESAPLPGD